ncbi:uncharacterized protein LOC125799360 isoform X1 [Astyanax mexicanus]|uniref:uncharacterized protein LOC125799360 isoform X1 n=1 Tax=Astyanax mexicanus TaxID=7994 RepID=UPI0020CB315D|nr:uncharacterized protein LOC125799360 isoform X1 [Astyanax mexicanus]
MTRNQTTATTDQGNQLHTNLTQVTHGIRTSVNQNQTNSTAVTQRIRTSAPRPDWLLYTIPSIAFVIGLLLFITVCNKLRPRESARVRKVSAIKTIENRTTSEPNNICSGSIVADPKTESSLKKQEAQSYENVSAAIYNNQDEVTYYVTQDDDYITPDAMEDYMTMQEQNQSNHLQPPHNTTDTDGESYENMEACVYAQPRNSRRKHTVSPEDDESYENMEGTISPYKSHLTTHNSTNTLDDESYERMDSIQAPGDVRERADREGEQWYFRQKTV